MQTAISPASIQPMPEQHLLVSYWVPVALVIVSALSLAVDLPVSRWFLDGNGDGLHRLLGLSEVFAHGTGVAGILLVIFVLDAAHRRALFRVAAASLGAGGLANLAKLIAVRIRPQHYDFEGNVWDTFGQFLPPLGLESKLQSFPSAHAATAAGLAVGLVWLYPRGRVLFPVLAVLASMQRIETGAHYPSDALFGAAFGSFIAISVTRDNALGRFFDKLENRSPNQQV